MKRILVIVAAIAVSACGPAAARSAPEATTPEVPDPAPALVAETASVATGQNEATGAEATGLPGDGPADPTVDEEDSPSGPAPTSQTTVPPPAAAVTTTTTSTIPEIALDLDLSELDELLSELNGLLGGLEPVMNQSEGEITP